MKPTLRCSLRDRICAFVPERYLTQSEIGYKFNPQGLNTLNNQLLIDITNESAHRQEILRVVFPDENLLTPEDKLKSKQLFDQII
jgi:hypothetical protein